jgi:hypothetical protein
MLSMTLQQYKNGPTYRMFWMIASGCSGAHSARPQNESAAPRALSHRRDGAANPTKELARGGGGGSLGRGCNHGEVPMVPIITTPRLMAVGGGDAAAP